MSQYIFLSSEVTDEAKHLHDAAFYRSELEQIKETSQCNSGLNQKDIEARLEAKKLWLLEHAHRID